jgi:hypothetical protein
MENGVVNGGKKGKSQGIEGSANAYDLLSFLLLIESLPIACKFHPLLLFSKQGTFN